MREHLLSGFLVALGIGAVAFAYKQEQAGAVDPMSATVKLSIDKGGHGSATHIGNGYLITAGHVATKEGQVLTARFNNGEEFEAVTLWSNSSYDIALLKMEDRVEATIVQDGASLEMNSVTHMASDLPSSNLECRAPALGEDLTLLGNPLAMEFIQTYGKVSGDVTDSYSSAWQAVTPMSGAMAGGMSGGGAFDSDGDLVGVNVGIPLQRIGMSSTFTGISFIVPGEVVCGLLARTE